MPKQTLTYKPSKNKKLVVGVGTNDADYPVYVRINGKRLVMPAYRAWNNMLTRCYSDKFHIKQPTYIGCTVSEDWLYFTSFKQWHDDNYVDGRQLDKDLLIKGNKIYSPNTCVYIPSALNTLLNDRAAERGNYPIGVSFNKEKRKYETRCKHPASSGGSNKIKFLGYYDTPEIAHNAYIEFKSMVIRKSAQYYLNRREIDLKLFNALVDIGQS